MPAEQKVAYAAADQKTREARVLQPVKHLEGVFGDVLATDAVISARNDRWAQKGTVQVGLKGL
jgi:hypothetical protein